MAEKKQISERMFEALSDKVNDAVRAPGAGLAREWRELDGRTLLVVCNGDSFDVYHGRQEPIVFSVSPRIVLQLLWWLVWSWWIVRTWCGLKTRLWAWSLERVAHHAAQPNTR